jgi:hypothetical protein
VLDAVNDDEKVPSALVVTDGGSGLEFGEVKVIVFEPIPILPAELSVNLPVTVTFVPQGAFAIVFNTSADKCFNVL